MWPFKKKVSQLPACIPPGEIEEKVESQGLGFFVRALGELLIFLMDRQKAKEAKHYLPGPDIPGGRRMISAGITLEQEGERLAPNERWAVINNHLVKIKIPQS